MRRCHTGRTTRGWDNLLARPPAARAVPPVSWPDEGGCIGRCYRPHPLRLPVHFRPGASEPALPQVTTLASARAVGGHFGVFVWLPDLAFGHGREGARAPHLTTRRTPSTDRGTTAAEHPVQTARISKQPGP